MQLCIVEEAHHLTGETGAVRDGTVTPSSSVSHGASDPL